MKRFFHPQHGYHVATVAEVEALLKTGWKECGWEVKKDKQENVHPFKREILRLKKGQ